MPFQTLLPSSSCCPGTGTVAQSCRCSGQGCPGGMLALCLAVHPTRGGGDHDCRHGDQTGGAKDVYARKQVIRSVTGDCRRAPLGCSDKTASAVRIARWLPFVRLLALIEEKSTQHCVFVQAGTSMAQGQLSSLAGRLPLSPHIHQRSIQTPVLHALQHSHPQRHAGSWRRDQRARHCRCQAAPAAMAPEETQTMNLAPRK